MVMHFIGCEGSSMKVLARIAQSMGHTVTGSDAVLHGHDAKNVIGADMVVYSSAIADSNPELAEAKKRNIPYISRARFLGEVCKSFRRTLAVSGAHGKTTTTAMLGCIFSRRDPTVHLGGRADGECGHVGGKEYFITEACEYKRSFLELRPDCAVILNVDLDHTDCYSGIDDVHAAFQKFAGQSRTVFVCADDKRASRITAARKITFGTAQGADFTAKNIVEGEALSFEVFERQASLGRFDVLVAGRHNVVNALAAIAVARYCGLPADEIREGLKKFKGVERRFEKVGEYNGSPVYSDYAHHPAQIEGVIDCAKKSLHRPVTVAFEPHTFTRLSSLLPQFVTALSKADRVYLLPVYPAREEPMAGVSSQLLVRGLMQQNVPVKYFDCYCSLVRQLRKAEGETVLVLGAGTIDRCARLIFDKDYL